MRKIGKYTITGMLGKGGMGKVLKVTYPITEKVAALKLLSPTPLLDRIIGRKRLERIFTQEAVTLAQIRHPHVVEILDFDYHQGRPFYLMDFHSIHLGQLIGGDHGTDPSRPLGVEKTIHYMTQALQGLACLHFTGIVHRDMKPANLLITQADQVKICDFGLSKLRGETFTHQDKVRIGSPYYAAPEQEMDPDKADIRSDIFSMGVMIFRLLTGEMPGPDIPSPSRLNPDLDEAWETFLAKAMAPDPTQRHQSAQEMEGELTLLGQRWREKMEGICQAPELFLELETPSPPQPAPPELDSQPRKLSKTQAMQRLDLDPLMRPNHVLPQKLIPLDDHQILDPASGRVWEQGGTPFPLNWKNAKAHVQSLNLLGEGKGWRLPTLAELLTLVRPLPQGVDHCLPPQWNPTQKILWTADRCSFASAWFVHLELGFAGPGDMSGFFHVKAVRSATPEELKY
ncbi:MAG: protein kinase [Desulfobacterales bacterium]|nr:protein kinase [Desulfobacterales bacterium]